MIQYNKGTGGTANMYCNQCGKQLVENSKFCSYCGAKVADSSKKEPEVYSLVAPMWDLNDTLKKLLKEVLGYNDDEIRIMESEYFCRNVANNLTIEQAKNITEIFMDNGFRLHLNDGRGYDGIIHWREIGITLQENPPKAHYCDTPIISREQLADLSTPNELKSKAAKMKKQKTVPLSRVICPYCHSTNVRKLPEKSVFMADNLFWGSKVSEVGKNFHCNKCGADF